MSTTPKRMAVFSLRTHEGKTVWTRAGSAWTNSDGSINVFLDVLPIDGKLHLREALDGKDVGPPLEAPGLQGKKT